MAPFARMQLQSQAGRCGKAGPRRTPPATNLRSLGCGRQLAAAAGGEAGGQLHVCPAGQVVGHILHERSNRAKTERLS